MAGAAIAINDASAADTIFSVKQRVFAANRKLAVRRQRLVYLPGPFGMDALADDETLGGAGVARDCTAELDVLVADLTEEEMVQNGNQVCSCFVVVMPVVLYEFYVFSLPVMRMVCLLVSLSRFHFRCTDFRDQLLSAANDGRENDISELLDEGVDVDYTDRVR
jgi:hypothetical protein